MLEKYFELFHGQIQKVRILIYILGFLMLFGYWNIQILKHTYYARIAETNRIQTQTIYPERGLIVDREGKILATSSYVSMLMWLPQKRSNPYSVIQELLQKIDWNPETREKLLKKAKTLSSVYPALLNIPMTLKEIAQFEFWKEHFPQLSLTHRPVRMYPAGEAFSHILGYVGWMTEQERKLFTRAQEWPLDSYVGKTGIERMYEGLLHGEPGQKTLIVDVVGHPVRELVHLRKPAVSGYTLHLTVDSDLQRIAYTSFGSQSGAFVALSAKTGEVRALVSVPSYDANAFLPFMNQETWISLVNNEKHPLQNKALQGLYSPGSTLKPFIALYALLKRMRTPYQTVFCPGFVKLFDHTFRCWQAGGHGEMNLHDALVHSCDVYFYTLGAQINIDSLADFLKRFGFGKKTGIDLPNEKEGLLPTRAWKRRVRKEVWYQGETVSVSIGQGPLLVTPLQLAVALATLLNEGVQYEPYLLEKATQGDQVVFQREPVVIQTFPLPKIYVEKIKNALCDVVQSGTGRLARLKEERMCGKTGTVELITQKEKIPQHLQEKYAYHAWFVGWVELPQETLVFSLIVEHGGHGGETAAPLARKIFEQYLRSTSHQQVIGVAR